jgi:hypothetical protein
MHIAHFDEALNDGFSQGGYRFFIATIRCQP